MNIHKNARLTPHGRERIVRQVESGQTPKAVAEAAGVCPRTVRKWVERYRREGLAGLKDRSSRPHRLRRPTPQAIVEQVEALAPPALDRQADRRRSRRLAGHRQPHPQAARAQQASGAGAGRAGAPLRARASRRADPHRHQEARPVRCASATASPATAEGSAIAARGIGWEFVHVCIDDASRIAFAKIMPNEKKRSAIAFLKAAVAYYESLGVSVERVMTDNGSCYKSFAFRRPASALGLKHIRTKPYTPKTNGKAERFIQTSLREWAYAQAYPTLRQRTAELPLWLHRYNWHQPHAGIGC